MKSKSNYVMTALIVLGIAIGCSTTGKKSPELTAKVTAAKAEFLKSDENLQTVLAKASGYVIFPTVAKGAMGIGAAEGKGQLFETGKDQPVGETALSQVTI